MATERSEHGQWFDEQVAQLVELGYSLIEAEKRQQWILDNLPMGADPATHIFDSYILYDEPSAPENELDSRAAFMASDDTPGRFKRLLAAKEETE